MLTLMVFFLSKENLVLLSKKGALCTLSSIGIIWHYLECSAGVFLNKETSSNILFIAFMV